VAPRKALTEFMPRFYPDPSVREGRLKELNCITFYR
jgi:hypothetical protein